MLSDHFNEMLLNFFMINSQELPPEAGNLHLRLTTDRLALHNLNTMARGSHKLCPLRTLWGYPTGDLLIRFRRLKFDDGTHGSITNFATGFVMRPTGHLLSSDFPTNTSH